ncbi:MAG: FtsX-like permease family protein [Gammaproteobacteria bacterium]|nr:FtsX-like permease family protein [Gammaproteobacteria bacterium]
MLPLKMLRDLWHLRGQALAIALVIAAGLSTWILSLSTMRSLDNTMDAYYSAQRFGDVFAEAVRVPSSVIERIREIEGVATVQARTRLPGRAELEGFPDSITVVAHSLPDNGRAAVNRLYLQRGAMPSADAREAVVSEAFAEAHGLVPGDTLALILRGREIRVTVTGMASNPEYIYQIAPGALFPDHLRYAVLWMRNRQLEPLADMRGAFNSLSLRLAGGANEKHVIAAVDDLLTPYGGVGAYAREDQMSHLYLTEEMRQLENTARIFPLIFLGVAVFLLAVVIGRMVRQQREEIATLKAFGYSNAVIGLHYFLLVVVIVAIGGVIGIIGGAELGKGLANMYADYFRFPYLYYSLGTSVVASGILLTLAAALAGTWHNLRAAWRLTPAEAMRPEPPERYHRSGLERFALFHRIGQTTRMILRHLERRRLKSLLTILGLATSVSILMVGNFQGDAVDHMITVQYGLASREDVTVTFDQPRGPDAILELKRLDGIHEAVPYRAAAARISHGHRSIRTGIQAWDDHQRLHRALDADLRSITLPKQGLLLSEYHAAELGVMAGDRVSVELLEGRRPVFETTVAAVVREYVGASSYMHIETLNALLFEPGRASGAWLATDALLDAKIDAHLRELPAVAGVNRSEEALQSFRETMNELVIVFAFVNTLLAGVIAFGVIYNSARLALSERERELASLRVLGYTRSEVAWILNGELVLLAVLALPVGFGFGYALCWLIATRMTSELYTIPLVLEGSTYVFAAAIAAAALLVSLLIVRRQTYRLDLVGVLKTRE